MMTSEQKLNKDPVGVKVGSFNISTVCSSCASGRTRPAATLKRPVSVLHMSHCTSLTRATRAYCSAQLRTAAVSTLARVATKLCLFRFMSVLTAPRALRLPSGLTVAALSTKKAGTQNIISSTSSIICRPMKRRHCSLLPSELPHGTACSSVDSLSMLTCVVLVPGL
eukprot:5792-Heterococcus_DN1.PRE.3